MIVPFSNYYNNLKIFWFSLYVSAVLFFDRHVPSNFQIEKTQSGPTDGKNSKLLFLVAYYIITILNFSYLVKNFTLKQKYSILTEILQLKQSLLKTVCSVSNFFVKIVETKSCYDKVLQYLFNSCQVPT